MSEMPEESEEQRSAGENGGAVHSATGRDARTGRFLKGWRGGSGRPPVAKVRRLAEVARSFPDAMRAANAVQLAMQYTPEAIECLLRLVLYSKNEEVRRKAACDLLDR